MIFAEPEKVLKELLASSQFIRGENEKSCKRWAPTETNKFNSEACNNRKGPKRQSHGQVKLTRCVPHSGLAIYVKKYLKAKRKIMETQIFHHAKKIIIFKKTSERNQNPSRYYNSITNLKF